MEQFDDAALPPSLEITDTPVTAGEVKVDEYGQELTAHSTIARQVADLVKAGVPLSTVEKTTHVSLTGNSPIKAKVMALLAFEMPAEERRRIVRARMNRIVLEGEDNDAVKAAKIIADDPEVNISQQKNAPDINITFSKETLNLFQQLSGEEVPGE